MPMEGVTLTVYTTRASDICYELFMYLNLYPLNITLYDIHLLISAKTWRVYLDTI